MKTNKKFVLRWVEDGKMKRNKKLVGRWEDEVR